MTASRHLLASAAILILVSAAPAGAAQLETVRQRVHVVAAGETLWSIASRHGVTVETLAAVNRLASPDRLQVGTRIAVPSPNQQGDPVPQPAGRHLVRSGETLWDVSQMHRTTPAALAKLNGLADERRIQIGQTLQVVGRLPPVSGRLAGPVAAPAVRSRLAWPSRGVITSRFGFRGRRHHHGIDIAAPIGTPIMAARDGVVQFVGWKGAYGALVILDHGGGLTTWYGHASKLLVGAGERVGRGQIIAKVGTTGRVTGPNLHFEVRRNDAPLDPLRFLQGIR